MGKLEGKRPLGRPRCRWEDDIKTDLREVGNAAEEWIDFAQVRGPMVGLRKGGNKPQCSIKTNC